MGGKITFYIMDVLGVSQLSKQYKTPAYVRQAVIEIPNVAASDSDADDLAHRRTTGSYISLLIQYRVL